MRASVSRLDKSRDMFEYYSSLNHEALALIEHASGAIGNKKLRELIDSYVAILWMKERSGQSRGKLNGVFASKSASLQSYAKINEYLAGFDQHIQSLSRNKNSEVYALIQSLQASDVFRQVDQIQKAFLATSLNDLSNVSGPDSTVWFSLATKRIKSIKAIADTVGEKIVAEAQQYITRAQTLFWIGIGVGIVIVLVLTCLGWWIALSICDRVLVIKNTLGQSIAESDLTRRVNTEGQDEISEIATSINAYIEWLGSVIEKLREECVLLEQQGEAFVTRASNNRNIVKEQQEQLQSIASSVTEMSASVAEVAQSCQLAADLTSHAKEAGEEGTRLASVSMDSANALAESMAQSESIITDLAKNSTNIGGIIDAIRGIAEQTNLLALNAAIEAARAGEQGRGFAVVADEVRSLAGRTQESTQEINQLISELQVSAELACQNLHQSQNVVQQAIASAKASSDIIEKINDVTKQTDEQTLQIASAAEEQSVVSNDVANNVEVVSAHADEALSNAENIDTLSYELAQVIKELNSLTARFRL